MCIMLDCIVSISLDFKINCSDTTDSISTIKEEDLVASGQTSSTYILVGCTIKFFFPRFYNKITLQNKTSVI